MNKIVSNIRRIREQKGYSQDYMGVKLGITQSSYSRIESEDAALSIEQLQKIADILETDISAFLDASKITIQNYTNNDVEFVNGCVENLYIENKETTKKLIQTLEDNIQQLKNENQHLKKQIEFLNSLITKNNP